MLVCAADDRVRFARSQAVRRRRRARGLSLMSFLFLRLNSCRGRGGREGRQQQGRVRAELPQCLGANGSASNMA